MNEKQKKLETLRLVTDLMNHLSLIGAREEWRKMGDEDILSYIGDDATTTQKTQMFLEWVYVGNRVGGGVLLGLLDEVIVFHIWKPEWWMEKWTQLKPLVRQERKRRKNPELYWWFEHFAEKAEKTHKAAQLKE